MEDGTYLSYDEGQTMTKVFDDIRTYSYRDKVYILREDGIYVSDYEGRYWEKLSDYTPDMAARDLYPSTGYDAFVEIVWEDKMFFRIGGDDPPPAPGGKAGVYPGSQAGAVIRLMGKDGKF